MIDIPLGKALVLVEGNNDARFPDCVNCYNCNSGICPIIACSKITRKDGKNVIFKLVDYLVKE
jgi:hypothetical protein